MGRKESGSWGGEGDEEAYIMSQNDSVKTILRDLDFIGQGLANYGQQAKFGLLLIII